MGWKRIAARVGYRARGGPGAQSNFPVNEGTNDGSVAARLAYRCV